MLEESLRFLSASVITVATAEAAMARLGEVDVVVTDYALPGGHDGVWLLEQMRTEAPGVPAILLSGYAASQVQAVADAPFALKLLKPIDPLELARQVGLVLGRTSN